MAKEHIFHEAGNNDAWICVCGNTPSLDGFYSCDRQGKDVTTGAADTWLDPLFVCDRCGRIIDRFTLEVVGRRAEPGKAVI